MLFTSQLKTRWKWPTKKCHQHYVLKQVITIKSTHFVVIIRRDDFVCTTLNVITCVCLCTTESNANADSVPDRWYNKEEQDWGQT